MILFRFLPVFFSSKKVSFEIDANPFRSQNVILWGGGGCNPSRDNLRSLRNSFVFKKKIARAFGARNVIELF